MRARIVIMIGLFVIGNAGALATAPQIVDPREDLFPSGGVTPKLNENAFQKPAPSPASNNEQSSEQSGAAKPASAPELPPKASAAAPEMPANPLWAIPLSQLTETRDRPPFSVSRRPPAQAVAVARPVAPVAPAAPPKPPEPVKPQLSLVGTVTGHGGGLALFVDAADKSTISLKAGQNHKGWVLRTVESHQVELASGLDSAVLKLPPPDMKPVVGALPPPYPVTVPQAQVPSPVTPQPANAALSNPPGGQPAAKLQIQPLVYDPPPPPAATNPFADMVKLKGSPK